MRKTEYVPLALTPQVQQPALPYTGLSDPVRYCGVEFDRDGRLCVVCDYPVMTPTATDPFKRVGVVRVGDQYDEAHLHPAVFAGKARDPATGHVYLVYLFDVPQ